MPCHPRLVELLRSHMNEFGTAPDGRLFRSRYHNRPLSESTVWQVWRKDRAAALSRQERASALARRPYDLRHACVTTGSMRAWTPHRSPIGPATASRSSSAFTSAASPAATKWPRSA